MFAQFNLFSRGANGGVFTNCNLKYPLHLYLRTNGLLSAFNDFPTVTLPATQNRISSRIEWTSEYRLLPWRAHRRLTHKRMRRSRRAAVFCCNFRFCRVAHSSARVACVVPSPCRTALAIWPFARINGFHSSHLLELL